MQEAPPRQESIFMESVIIWKFLNQDIVNQKAKRIKCSGRDAKLGDAVNSYDSVATTL
jgi:hypothetical protein